MEQLRISNENEMILEFLKGEIKSDRFNEELKKTLRQLHLDSSIINNGNILNGEENLLRLKIMKLFRGYPDEELFKNFPQIDEWTFVKLSSKDIDNVYYIDYDYWNELSNGTSKPSEAAKAIKSGKEIYDVSNQPFLDGVEYVKENKFPPVILITCNNEKFLIIEGHSRMTVYGLDPSKLEGTFAYIGHCTSEEMKKYDARMLPDNYIKRQALK